MIHDLRVAFENDWPLWVIGAIALTALGTTLLFYRRAARTVRGRYLWLLIGLRAVAVVTLLLCLFRPAISYQRGVVTRTTLLMLVDASRSMSINDFPGQPNRLERVRGVMLDPKGGAEKLDRDFDVRWYVFDRGARPLKEKDDLLKVKAEGDVTDLLTSSKGAKEGSRGPDLGGIVLVTDGVDTATGDPVPELAGLGVPFFAVGVGSVLSAEENYRDIMIDRVEAPREATVRTIVPIEVYVEAMGFANRVMPVVLTEDGVEVGRGKITLDNSVGAQKVKLRYQPKKKGDFELSVRIPADPDERIEENNAATFPIFVGDPKIRVLYIEGVVRSEYRELRRTMAFDPNVEMLSLVRIAANTFTQQGHIADVRLDGVPKTLEEWDQFKVVILGSLDRRGLSNEQVGQIKEFVSEGGGVMMIGGEYSFGPGGYGGTPVEEVLPVVCGGRKMGQEREPFHLTVTPSGRSHPIFAGITDFFTSEGRAQYKLPKLLGCVRVMRAKPATETLAVNAERQYRGEALPAVVVGRYGKGRSMAATIDSTHLWYRPLRGMGRKSPYVRYWGQAVRWLAGSDETQEASGPGLTAFMDKHFYEPGQAPVIRALVTDVDGQATNRATVKAAVLRDGKEKVAGIGLAHIEGTRNEYEMKIVPPKPGKYEVVVTAEMGPDKLGEARLKFRMGAPTREFEKLDLNLEGLKKIAAATNGVYLPLMSFGQLADVLRARSEEKIEPERIALWNSPLLFASFVLLLTGEWILRKRRLLS